jgi:hypothetical protein
MTDKIIEDKIPGNIGSIPLKKLMIFNWLIENKYDPAVHKNESIVEKSIINKALFLSK